MVCYGGDEGCFGCLLFLGAYCFWVPIVFGCLLFLGAYWSLERIEVDMKSQLEKEGIVVAKEHGDKCNGFGDHTSDATGFQVENSLAITVSANVGSRKVLEKLGSVMVKEFKDWDTGGDTTYFAHRDLPE